METKAAFAVHLMMVRGCSTCSYWWTTQSGSMQRVQLETVKYFRFAFLHDADAGIGDIKRDGRIYPVISQTYATGSGKLYRVVLISWRWPGSSGCGRSLWHLGRWRSRRPLLPAWLLASSHAPSSHSRFIQFRSTKSRFRLPFRQVQNIGCQLQQQFVVFFGAIPPFFPDSLHAPDWKPTIAFNGVSHGSYWRESAFQWSAVRLSLWHRSVWFGFLFSSVISSLWYWLDYSVFRLKLVVYHMLRIQFH